MKLSEKQRFFSWLFFKTFLPKAFRWAVRHGYELQIREVLRSEASARANAANGTGIVNSNHRRILAVDLLLWQGGQPVWDTSAYEALGKMWKRLSTTHKGEKILCCWGGDFRGRTGPDGGHFSFYHKGVK